jgi:CheY-like chemotaxis protein/bifunctional DNA-binding transcriptional regulator/antitoxin component of YhaV-PrlF toxin-antitoxin module
MRFYKKVDNNYMPDRFTILDTIKVDDHSRISFTKRIREFFPIKEGDIITVYKDNVSNNHDKLVFKIQRDDVLIDTFTLMRDSFNANKTIKKLTDNQSSNSIVQLHANVRYISILLVDDEEDVLLGLSIALAGEGYIAKSFNDSQKALYHLIDKVKNNSKPYDIIIIDIRMPIINGIQLYQILKILNSQSKVLLMTGLDVIDELCSLIPDIRPQDILRKPFGNAYLLQKIKEKLEQPLY